MYPISFVIIFAFHPKLDIHSLIIERSFSHPLEKLTDISYLTSGMLENFDAITAEKFRDCAINVSRKKDKFSISELHRIEVCLGRFKKMVLREI